MKPDYLTSHTTAPRRATYREELHVALDELIDGILVEKICPGGEQRVTDVEVGRVLRLTLCEFTNEKVCNACEGTGLSEKPTKANMAGRN
jgi:hypothetical protein